MVFGRFFRRGDGDEPPVPPDDEQDEAEDGDDAPDGPPEGDPDADLELDWRQRAAAVIPGGASTGSKRADALYGPGTSFGPTHYVRAGGCRSVTAGGRTLIDNPMALGSVPLG